jgi:hypothetical protein
VHAWKSPPALRLTSGVVGNPPRKGKTEIPRLVSAPEGPPYLARKKVRLARLRNPIIRVWSALQLTVRPN